MAIQRRSLGPRDHLEHYFRNLVLKIEFQCLQAGLPRGMVVKGLRSFETIARSVGIIP